MKQRGKTILTLTGLATISMSLINHIQYSLSTAGNILASRENNYYEWRFGKIRYLKKGSGTPVLLLHNLTVGSSSYEFHYMIDDLAKHHEVYAFDFLGYGLSDKPNMTYTNYMYVQLLNDFIKNVIGRKTNVIATGDAAPVCIMTCHNEPELFSKLTLINPPSLFHLNQIPSNQLKALKLLFETPILGTFIYNMLTTKRMFTKAFQDEYFFHPHNMKDTDLLAYVEASHVSDYNSKYSYASFISKYMNANIVHALKEINHSIYIIGGKEILNNQTIVDNYLYYNSSIESSFIEKTKLLPHMERPKEVLSILYLYLNS